MKTKIEVRPAVKRFAEQMEVVLQANDHKGDPTNVHGELALMRLWEEMRELDREAYGHPNIQTSLEQKKRIQKEAVDVANFALMLWYAVDD